MSASHEFQRRHWFSPGFPVGGYAYSHGIEAAVAAGDIADAETLASWIGDLLRVGSGRNEAILIGECFRRMRLPDDARGAALAGLAELAIASSAAAERRLESCQQGAAFFRLVQTSWPHADLPALPKALQESLPFPVAAGIAGAAHGHRPAELAAAYLQGFAGNLLAAGIRLAVIGQSEAQARLAGFLPAIERLAMLAETAGLADLGGFAFRADLMALRHETLETRLFRS